MSAESRLEALSAAFKRYHETRTICRADGCRWGFVAPDPADIDPWTEEPRRVPCSVCDGHIFVPRQQELPF